MKKHKNAKMLQVVFLIGLISIVLIECKKEKTETPTSIVNSPPVTYSSIDDFYNKNGVQLQTYTINGATGGTFTSPQGTKVTIPPYAFGTGTSNIGDIQIEFKDIYKKSDMLLSNIPTQTDSGILKSGGEFFIKAVGNTPTAADFLASGKSIIIEQPLMGQAIDSLMAPFMFRVPLIICVGGGVCNPPPIWMKNQNDNVNYTLTSYIYNLYQFQSPANAGSWCNSDNPTYFSAYPKTHLTMHPTMDSATVASTNVFLVFTGINSMVHVYQGSAIDFPYLYAPVGLHCTVVALTVKDGKVYSSFTPITISVNQTVNFTVTETTTEAFKTALDALN